MTAETRIYIDRAMPLIDAKVRSMRPEILKLQGNVTFEKKADNSSVTHLDLHIEHELKNTLAAIDQSYGFWGEEHGIEGSTERFWLIDPIDGTEAFVRGLPFSSCMVCLIVDDQPQASMIYLWNDDEVYTAIRDEGATKNGQQLHVSQRPIDRAGIVYEFREQQALESAIGKVPSYFRYDFAAAGYGFAQIANGSLEAYVCYKPWGKVYDYPAGALLVQESGGRVTAIDGSPYDYSNTDFIASNGCVHDAYISYFKGLQNERVPAP